jgi:predicted aconitase
MKQENDEIEINDQGAKQSFLGEAHHLIPQKAIKELSTVFYKGAEKYGVDNWRKLGDDMANSVDTNLNHALHHINSFLINKNTEDISHAAARILMALEMYLEREDE